MADHLSVCMTCGRYTKGTSHDSDELFKNHLCNASREQVKKNMLECMAILRTLNGTCAIGTIESTLPPPPTPNSIQLNDVFKANFDEVHKELKLKLMYVEQHCYLVYIFYFKIMQNQNQFII